MGWSSGSMLASELIENAMSNIPDPEARSSFYRDMISSFENYDCDTLDECLGVDEAFDLVYKELYGFEDEDEEEDDLE